MDPPAPVAAHASAVDLDDEDESVRIAVRALGDTRNGHQAASSIQGTPALSISSQSATTTPSLPSPAMTQHSGPSDLASVDLDPNSPGLAHRVSAFPLVGTALRAYEQGKASSRVVKYGAEMMESSVKTISRPVIDRLPVNGKQLDDFACRQLDRLERYRRPSSSDPERMQLDSTSPASASPRALSPDRAYSSPTRESHARARREDSRERGREVPTWLEATSPFVKAPPPPPEAGSSRTPTPSMQASPPQQQEREGSAERQVTVAPRARWQAVLSEAGGLSAAWSEESMRRLKYSLQWLQYATTHIDAQILILRDFMASLQARAEGSNPEDSEPISPTHLRTLTDVRRDVVHTVRQVVDVVSKYAGGALPEPARSRVRGFILHLPARWANAAQDAGAPPRRARYRHHRGESSSSSGAGTGGRVNGSPASSRAPSPANSLRGTARSPLAPGHGAAGHGHIHAVAPTAGAATQSAKRILTLATESLDMMRGVTGVVKDSLDRADAWVDRLRHVGLQRGQSGDEGLELDPALRAPPEPYPDDDNASVSAGIGSPFASGPPTPALPASIIPDSQLPMGALQLGEVEERDEERGGMDVDSDAKQ